MSTLQEMYDFAKNDMDKPQSKIFQFTVLPEVQDNDFNIRLADRQFFLQGKVLSEANEILNQASFKNNQMLVELKQWKLEKVKNQIIVIIYELICIGSFGFSNQLEPFVPKDTEQIQTIQGTQNLQQKEIHFKDGEYYDIRGRVIFKSDIQIWQRCNYFKIDIQLQDGFELQGIVWDKYENYYWRIQINQTYLFSDVLVFWNDFENCQEFKVNEYSKVVEEKK